MTKEERTDGFYNMLLQFCSKVVVNQLSLTIRYYPPQEEEKNDEGMCAEAAVIPIYESPMQRPPCGSSHKRLEKEIRRREEEAYQRGQAEAFLSIIEAAVRLAPDRDCAEIKEIRNTLLQVMPHEYHDRIKHISSARNYTNNYRMEYNKYNNCTIGAVNEGNGTVHVHMDGEKKKPTYDESVYAEEVDDNAEAQSLDLSDDQQAAFDRAVEGNFLRSLGNGKYNLVGKKVSLAYFIGRLFCRDYVEHKDKMRIWKAIDDFPTKAMTAMFGIDDLATIRSARKNGTPPKDYRVIDGFIEE